MTNCKQFEELIFESVDGNLPGSRRKEFDAHLSACPHCAELHGELRRVRTQLKGLRPVKTSADFDTVLRTRIRMERSMSRKRLLAWPVSGPVYAATGALVVVVAFFVFRPDNGGYTTESGIIPIYEQEQSVDPAIQQSVNFPIDIYNPSGGGGMNVTPVSGGNASTDFDQRPDERSRRDTLDTGSGGLKVQSVDVPNTIEF